MPPEEQDRSRYYQEIAAAFFKQKGGGSLLSSRDLGTIASWEALGIPLETVREGIEKAFEYHRTIASVRRNIRTLAACGPQVLKAFERRRERAVGRSVKVKTRQEKAERIAAEARRFLESVPELVSFLREPYERAIDLLGREKPDEEALERLEARIERLLADRVPDKDREEARRAVAAEFPALRGAEAAEAVRLKLLKNLRTRFKIPYITFPYY